MVPSDLECNGLSLACGLYVSTVMVLHINIMLPGILMQRCSEKMRHMHTVCSAFLCGSGRKSGEFKSHLTSME